MLSDLLATLSALSVPISNSGELASPENGVCESPSGAITTFGGMRNFYRVLLLGAPGTGKSTFVERQQSRSSGHHQHTQSPQREENRRRRQVSSGSARSSESDVSAREESNSTPRGGFCEYSTAPFTLHTQICEEESQSNEGSILCQSSCTKLRLGFFELGGEKEWWEDHRMYYRQAHGALVFFDDDESLNIAAELKHTLDMQKLPDRATNVPCLLVATQRDIAESEHGIPSPRQLDTFCQRHNFIGWAYSSPLFSSPASLPSLAQRADDCLLRILCQKMIENENHGCHTRPPSPPTSLSLTSLASLPTVSSETDLSVATSTNTSVGPSLSSTPPPLQFNPHTIPLTTSFPPSNINVFPSCGSNVAVVGTQPSPATASASSPPPGIGLSGVLSENAAPLGILPHAHSMYIRPPSSGAKSQTRSTDSPSTLRRNTAPSWFMRLRGQKPAEKERQPQCIEMTPRTPPPSEQVSEQRRRGVFSLRLPNTSSPPNSGGQMAPAA